MKKFALALDLKDDPELIGEYERWHKAENGWPEIKQSILDAGILSMNIYRTGNRLFMFIETTQDFSFELKANKDKNNLKVQEWEKLMSSFQQPLPWAQPNEKWVLMTEIFKL